MAVALTMPNCLRQISSRCFLQGKAGICLPRFLSVSSSKKDDRPKKPANSFLLYRKQVQDDVRKKFPDAPPKEIFSKIGQMYKQLPEAEVKSLKEDSIKLSEEYKKKLAEWESGLTNEDKQAIKEEKEAKVKKQLKKLKKENEMPKRPATAFVRYVAHNLNKNDLQFMGPTEKMKAMRENVVVCGKLWKELPETERKKYEEEFVKEKKLYEQKMKDWEAKMLEEGKGKLVRKKTAKKATSTIKKKTQKKATTKKNEKSTKSKKKSGEAKGASKKSLKKKVTFEIDSTDSD